MNIQDVYSRHRELKSKFGEFDNIPHERIIECCAILDWFKHYEIRNQSRDESDYRLKHDSIGTVINKILDVFGDKERLSI